MAPIKGGIKPNEKDIERDNDSRDFQPLQNPLDFRLVWLHKKEKQAKLQNSKRIVDGQSFCARIGSNRVERNYNGKRPIEQSGFINHQPVLFQENAYDRTRADN